MNIKKNKKEVYYAEIVLYMGVIDINQENIKEKVY